MRCLRILGALGVLLALSATAGAGTVASSTMWFQGQLEYNSETGAWTGLIGAIAGTYYAPGGPGASGYNGPTPPEGKTQGGFDVYAKEGATAYIQGGSPEVVTIVDHDYATAAGPWGYWYTPDLPDYWNYDLELSATNWSVNGFRGSSPAPPNMAVYAGPMNWGTMIATETGANWNPTWTWGVENVPLEYGAFQVQVFSGLVSGVHMVSLTPVVPEPFTMVSGFLAVAGLGVFIRRHMRAPAGAYKKEN